MTLYFKNIEIGHVNVWRDMLPLLGQVIKAGLVCTHDIHGYIFLQEILIFPRS